MCLVNKKGTLAKYVLAGLGTVAGIGLFSSQAMAAAVASSHAYDMSVNVNVIGLDALNVPAQAEVQFPAQAAAFADSDSVLSYNNLSVLGLISLTTGELNAAVEWIPSNAFSIVGAEGSVNGLNLGAVSLLSAPLLGLQTGLVKATAVVSGYCPVTAQKTFGVTSLHDTVADYIFVHGFDVQNLNERGDIDVSEGISLSVTGNQLLNIPTTPGPNTTLNLLGVATLILNEQNVGGDGISDRSISINAIHLTVNVVGLITADVIVAHADSAISCN